MTEGAGQESGCRPAQPGGATPFAAFAETPEQGPRRAAITAACRRPEPDCLPPLLALAEPTAPEQAAADALARRLVSALRAKGGRSAVDGLVQEYSLSTQEGVALMCLAEALLRIPDAATRDALIRDKIGPGDWLAHLGHSPSLFVNAATWGLAVTGRLATPASEASLAGALTRLVARGGEPLIRRGVDLAMRMMGAQFVTGETIEQALAHARPMEARGFCYSFDMLGEAAMTASDAERYRSDYARAIHAIGRAARGRGLYEAPGISIKLSALHPRYTRSQRARVMRELLPRVTELAALARSYGIGLNIDAEEADRLDLSLDILESLCLDPALAGWNGVGFVVQAYQKRAPHVLDWVIDLARRSGRRIMLRLVKGAYWDSEIKRAQVDGLDGFPVFTRKVHTDVCYLACARQLLGAQDAVFPQFATHNAQTLAAIHAMAGPRFTLGDYEFQCLHGMGEALYEEVVGGDKLDRPCRIYAPVGTHETLLAYLVRRLLENGANSSFVHRIADPVVPVAELVADPVAAARSVAPPGSPHPAIRAPRDLFPDRRNARGLDLANEAELAALSQALREEGGRVWHAGSILGEGPPRGGPARAVRNPADRRDRVGIVRDADPAAVEAALRQAAEGAESWAATPPNQRANCLRRAADLMEETRPALLGLIVREAGRTIANAVAEIREAVDFLRYYAGQGERFANDTHAPLGTVLCISPWNFPLAIFTGQVAAALAAGNAVLAKPAEETPLIAGVAVALLHRAGVPVSAVQVLPGDGTVGARLVGDSRVQGVMFTGSTEVARLIQARLAERLNPDGCPVPLVAETGGQNALVVDSSALPEQVVADILTSAFDSAGQRCSALRLLCLQEDTYDRTFRMLREALDQLTIGNPDRLATDLGPVITDTAAADIRAHVAEMRALGRPVHAAALPEGCRHGSFVPPTIIELADLADLTREVFGPVLHVLRFSRDGLDGLVDAINATGYGLTFGLHTRIDATVARVACRIRAGNVYVNRNLVGAVVGVQPFGGQGLSGTGPKAGGPLTLRRLLAACPPDAGLPGGPPPEAALAWLAWLRQRGRPEAVSAMVDLVARSPFGHAQALPSPDGESNRYTLHPRGAVLCASETEAGLLSQIGAVLATGNRAVLRASVAVRARFADLPEDLSGDILQDGEDQRPIVSAALWQGGAEGLRALARELAARDGPIVSLHGPRYDPATGRPHEPLEWLLHERTTSTNTSATGGNASLMMLE